MKKVFISGCYDMLHSGHISFFKEASKYGDLYVGIGSDKTIRELKGRDTVNSENERLFMIKSIKYVKDAWINSGSGIMDFEDDLIKFKPDIFIVNEDGNSPIKLDMCNKLGIEYVVLERIPEPGLTPRSTTDIRNSNNCLLPYRLDLAGTWIDQPYVNKFSSGWAITISLEPIVEYNERSGMSTSTRNAAKKIWQYQLPVLHPEKLAEILFSYENAPGNKEEVSGAQDSIGICVPGLCRHFYSDEKYWPNTIERIDDDKILRWLEEHIYLVPLWPREPNLDLLSNTNINKENVQVLTNASEKTWQGIINQNLEDFSSGFLDSFDAQIKMFPNMINEKIENVINQYRDTALAWKLAGAGGGGYLVLISDIKIKNSMEIKIRRSDSL